MTQRELLNAFNHNIFVSVFHIFHLISLFFLNKIYFILIIFIYCLHTHTHAVDSNISFLFLMTAESHNEKSNRESIYQQGQCPMKGKVHNSAKPSWDCCVMLTVSVYMATNRIHLRASDTSRNCNLFCVEGETVWVLGVPEGTDSPKECILFSTKKEVRMVRKWCEVSNKLKFVGTESMIFNVLKIGKYKKKRKKKKDGDDGECSVGMICFSPSSPGTHVWIVSQDLAMPYPHMQQRQQQQDTNLWHHSPFQAQSIVFFQQQPPQPFLINQQQQVMPVTGAQNHQAIYSSQPVENIVFGEPFPYFSFIQQ